TITAAAATAIGCGDLIVRNITAPGQIDEITFNGKAGDKITLTLTSALSFNDPARATVLSPTATAVVAFNANSQQQLTLSETGTYIIQVRAFSLTTTGSYSLGLECLLPTSPVDATLPCGGLVTRSINSPSQVDQFTFSAKAGDKI